MKARYHRKEPTCGGMTLYVMGRIVLGSQIEARLAVTARELAHHRAEVAYVLRRCRHELAREVERAWAELADRHMNQHYGEQGTGEP